MFKFFPEKKADKNGKHHDDTADKSEPEDQMG